MWYRLFSCSGEGEPGPKVRDSKLRLAGLLQHSLPSRGDPLAEFFKAQPRAIGSLEDLVNERGLVPPFKCGLKVCLVPKAQDAPVLFGKISKEGRVEQ